MGFVPDGLSSFDVDDRGIVGWKKRKCSTRVLVLCKGRLNGSEVLSLL